MTFKFDADDASGDHYSTTDGVVDEQSMLGVLSSAGILDLERVNEKSVQLKDGCDEYYALTVNRNQLLALSDEIRALAMSLTE